MAKRLPKYLQKQDFKAIGQSLNKSETAEELLLAVRDRFGQHAEIDELKMRHLHNCVFVCELLISRAPRRNNVSWSVVAKKFADKEDLIRAFQLMRTLWDNGFSYKNRDGISIAQPLVLAENLNLLFMEMVPGDKLRRLIKTGGKDGVKYMRTFARTLAKLHQCPIIPDLEMSVASELEDKEKLYCELMEAFPALRKSIQFIVQTSLQIADQFGMDICVPVHTDYNLGQLHIEGEHCWLLDFGNLRHGDPASDVGNVLTLALLNNEKKAVSNGDELLTAFKQEYYSLMDERDEAIVHRVPIYEALNLLFRACKYFHGVNGDRLARIEPLVKRAVACIERNY